MRYLYSFMWWLALPLVLGRLWLRGRQEPGYRQHWGERLGFYGAAHASGAADSSATATPVFWVHAVSVGETRAAEKLQRLLTNDPGMGVIRHADAGYERAIDVAAERGVRVPMQEQ